MLSKFAPTCLLATVSVLCLGKPGFGQRQEPDDEPVELSPFVVEDTSTDHYQVKTTNAGMRIRTDLKDFGASIAVINEQFLEDLGATDSETLLGMVGSMEIGGVQGNISQASPSSGSTNAARINPQEEQRVRGLASAILTRNYFRTNLPFDSYNTSSITINRAQNTMLFGFGSPGGVIESSVSKAQIGAQFGDVEVRVDHRGGHRQSLDLNQTLIQDRLAIRLALLNESTVYQQDPAFEKETRAYLAFEAVLLKNEAVSWLGKTRLRGNFEDAEILRNPPDVVPPFDGFSTWFEGIGGQEALNNVLRVPGTNLDQIPSGGLKSEWVLGAIEAGLVEVPEFYSPDFFAALNGSFVPKTEYNRLTGEGRNQFMGFVPYTFQPAVNFNSATTGTLPGWRDPELAGVQAFMARWRPNGFPDQDIRWTRTALSSLPGFDRTSLMARQVFDYHNQLWQGSTNEVRTDFQNSQWFLEQGLFDGKAGIEIAFDEQEREQSYFNPFSSGQSKSIFIDATSHHPAADSDFDGRPDRTPNENVGRPVTILNDTSHTWRKTNWETFRVTVFGKLDTQDLFSDFWGNLLGAHQVTGLYEDYTDRDTSQETRGVWWADQGPNPAEPFISGGNNNEFSRQVISQVYLGPDTRGFEGPEDVRVSGISDLRPPQIGDRLGVWYFDNRDEIDRGDINEWRVLEHYEIGNLWKREVESKAVSLQSHWLWNNLVTTVGFREDHEVTRGRLTADEITGPGGSIGFYLDDPGINPTDGNFNEALLQLTEAPHTDTVGDTSTWSVVGHYPENWLGDLPAGLDLSLHYYESDSFEPDFGEVNVFNEFLGETRSETREWGFTLGMANDRITLRFNRFETAVKDSPTTLRGSVENLIAEPTWYTYHISLADFYGIPLFPSEADRQLTPDTVPSNRQRTTGTDADLIGVNSYVEYYDKIFQIYPPVLQEIYNPHLFQYDDQNIVFSIEENKGTVVGTEDYVASGTEIELVGRPIDNWSLSLNIAQQETVRSNVGPLVVPLAFEMLERIKDLGFHDIRDNPFDGEETTIGDQFDRWVIRELRIAKGQEGIASPEQREWRVNLLTRYDFTESWLKGFSIGGALRYQDEVAAGYTNVWDGFGNAVPDAVNPFYGPDEVNGDLFLRYRKKLTEKLDWSIQFNARNLYRKNGDDDIPVTINPDGRVALIRIPNERQFFLTNTVRF